MGLFNWLTPETKSDRFVSPGKGIDVSGVMKDLLRGHGNITYSKLDEEQFVQEGWAKNPTVRGIIAKVQEASTQIKWRTVNGEGAEVENPLFNDLVRAPNAINTWSEFVQDTLMFHMLTGNAFIVMDKSMTNPQGVTAGIPGALVNLPAQNVQINISPDRFFIESYDLDYLSFTGTLPAEDVIHLRESNPDHDFDERNSFLYGTPRLSSASRALDTNNEIIDTIRGVFAEGGPRGILGLKMGTDPLLANQLDEAQVKKIGAQLQKEYKGGRNAGKFPINNLQWEWTKIGADIGELQTKEMLEVTAIEICRSFNFPPMVLGLGNSTYENQKEASKDMWESVVLPRVYSLKESLNSRLMPLFGDDIFLDCDLSDVAVLKEDEDKKATQYSKMNFLTVNEKREAFGYDPVPDGDTLDDPMRAFGMNEDEMEGDDKGKDKDE